MREGSSVSTIWSAGRASTAALAASARAEGFAPFADPDLGTAFGLGGFAGAWAFVGALPRGAAVGRAPEEDPFDGVAVRFVSFCALARRDFDKGFGAKLAPACGGRKINCY